MLLRVTIHYIVNMGHRTHEAAAVTDRVAGVQYQNVKNKCITFGCI